MAKMGELKRAAQQLGVTSTVLRQHGWKTATHARVEAAKADPPEWLVVARERYRKKRMKQKMLRDCKSTAGRLGIQVRAVHEHNINLGDVPALLADPPVAGC